MVLENVIVFASFLALVLEEVFFMRKHGPTTVHIYTCIIYL